MKYSLRILLTTIIVLAFFGVHAQNKGAYILNTIAENGKVKFRRYDVSVTARPADKEKELLKTELGITASDSLGLVTETNDELGFTHRVYQQFYKGIKVEHAAYATHIKDGNVVAINGDFANVGKPVIQAAINEAAALAKAINYINATTYAWQLPGAVNNVTKDNLVPSRYPKGELVICFDYLQTKTYRLAYKFAIAAVTPVSSDYVYVDAVNGKIVARQNLLFDGNVSTTGKTRYSGTQAMVTDQFTSGSSTSYRLREVRGTSNVTIQSFNSQALPNTAQVDFVDATNAWTTLNNTAMDDAAIDAHWASEKIYDYWNTVRSRNSYDGAGAALTSFVHYNVSTGTLNGVPQYNSGWDNARWDQLAHQVYFGDGFTQFKPLVSLDICAHEFGHGFTQGARAAYFASGGILINADNAHPEALALNEGISDIWGAVVENWGSTGKQTWLIGEEVMKNGKPCLRSLVNPKTGGDPTGNAYNGYPDTYHGTYWDYGNASHTNATVLGHWFYLLSQGGSGTNDVGSAYVVTGIGITSAASIVWRAEQNYLGPNSQYSDARTAMISAAVDLFGTCSPEVLQVTNAWYAVGVGTGITINSSYSITGAAIICTTQQYTVNNLPTGTTLIWATQQPYSSPTTSFTTGTSNPTTVTRLTGPPYNTVLYAALNVPSTGCVLTPVKSVHVGEPISESITGISLVPYPYYGIAGTVVTDAPSPYYWYVDGVLKKTTTSTFSDVVSGGQCGVQHYFQVGVTNGCNAQIKTLPYYFTNTCGMTAAVMAPNPASSSVTISTLNGSGKIAQSGGDEVVPGTNGVINLSTGKVSANSVIRGRNIVRIRIFDINGKLRKLLNYGANVQQVSISVADLNTGAYFIEIFDGFSTERKKLIVQK